MKLLKNLLICLFLGVSVVGVSSVALAEEGRISYKPVDAIEKTIEKIKAAQAAITDGKSAEEVRVLIKSAKDMSKEINANDKVDISRQRATGHLAHAIGAAKESDLKLAGEHLGQALTGFEDLKKLL